MDSQGGDRWLPLFGAALATAIQFALLAWFALNSHVADAILLIPAVGTAITAFRAGIELERVRVRQGIEA